MTNPPNPPEILMPDTFALVVGVRGAYVVESSGEVLNLSHSDVARRIRTEGMPIICHARQTATRLCMENFRGFDVLELFAFVEPARFCLPTPGGVAGALGLSPPRSHEDEAMSLISSVQTLLERMSARLGSDSKDARQAARLAHAMNAGGWAWAKPVLAALGEGETPHSQIASRAFRVWEGLPKWEERGGEVPPGDAPVSPQEARQRLDALLAGRNSESRPEQQKFTAGVTAAFDPCEFPGQPQFVLAEAGTGVGKTLGYVAPASIWADKNDGAVWLSTYTRNLQRQLDGEMDRLYPDPDQKKRYVVVRKGRENYFCILNFQEALNRLVLRPDGAIALGLVARWAGATRDGDMIGGDFPAWIGSLLGRGLTGELTDTKGECTYTLCEHFNRCFIEHSKRRAKRAKLVIANHALVMVQTALNAGGGASAEGGAPTRFVFDEGHHVFDAADSAFAAHLSGQETADLRRWILGAEDGRRSRSRGLKTRLEDLSADDDKLDGFIQEVRQAAHALPGPNWRTRLTDGEGGTVSSGETEAFLGFVRQQVYARNNGGEGGYSLECSVESPVDGLHEAAVNLDRALMVLETPLQGLIKRMLKKLDDEAAELETSDRTRIEGLAGSLERRALLPVKAWRAMLKALQEGTPEDFVDWMSVDRFQGRDMDIALNRHWVDPTKPFAVSMAESAQGVLITSATLRDNGEWEVAEQRTGSKHLASPTVYVAQKSPFNYAQQTRIFVVTDVNKNSVEQVSAAYRELFLAAGGGGLGLFTAIHRLRTVYERIAPSLDEQGFPLLAQHIDPLDVGTLVDIFKAETDACLFGTDAVRDGVDVPGDSLRLIVFDRVPWPRPDIITKARREAFGGRGYDEMLTRLKLKQAYGRLVRKKDDRGVFVMLDGALPSRIATAFPADVEIQRIGLKEAIDHTSLFLSETS
ncbi:MAG: ATP-dependent DNA helicase [Magnetovibrio sp.]|nr:ATP-dependent DNA helicase [Magnetovibrio sp.]